MRPDRTPQAKVRRRRPTTVRAALPAIKISVAHAGPPPAATAAAEIKELRGALVQAKNDHDALLAEELQMREEMEISRHRYAQLFDTAPVGYAVLDYSGVVREINLRGARMLQRRRDSLRGYPFQHLVAPEDRGRWLLFLAKLRQPEAKPEAIQLALATRQNKPRLVTVHCHQVEASGLASNAKLLVSDAKLLVSDAKLLVSDAKLFFSLAFVDVTTQQEAEQRVRLNEARFRSLIEHATETISIVDGEGIIHYQSPNIAAVLGYAVEDMVGRDAFEFVHPDDVAEARALFADVQCQPGRLRQSMVRGRHQHGPWRWLQITATNLIHDPAVAGVVLNTRDVTPEREALRAVQESEERFRTMADGAPVLIWLADASRRCLWFNQPWLEFTGSTLAEEIGHGWEQWVHPEDLEACLKDYRAAYDARQEFKLESRFKRRDGEWRWLLNHGVPLYGPDQTFTGYIGSCVDITERKAAAHALEEQARLLDLSNDAIIARDAKDRILYWNHGAEELYGYPRAEAVGKRLFKLLRTEFSEPLAKIEAKLARDGRWEGESVNRCREGRRITVATRWALDRDAEGRAVAVLQTDNDITARKAAEEQLRYQLQLFQNITAKAASSIFMTDQQHCITFVNPEAERTFGYTAREMIGQPLHKILRRRFVGELPYPDGETALQDIKRSPKGALDHQEMFLHKNDSVVAVNCSSAVLEVGGERVGAVFMLRDVTEQLRKEETQRRTHEELEARVVQRTEQLARAHELLQKQMAERAQLQEQILAAGENERARVAQDLHDGLCQLLLGIRFKLELLCGRLAKRSLPGVKHLRALGQLLDRATAEARGLARGLHPVEAVPEGLRNALTELADSTRRLFRVNCRCDVPRDFELADPAAANQLFRIAQEAVTNAIKHGQATRIAIQLTQDDRQLVLAVANNGSPVKTAAGPAGLGLRTMDYRATQIGAKIELVSKPDSEVVLRCVRPLAVKAAPAKRGQRRNARRSGVAGKGNRDGAGDEATAPVR